MHELRESHPRWGHERRKEPLLSKLATSVSTVGLLGLPVTQKRSIFTPQRHHHTEVQCVRRLMNLYTRHELVNKDINLIISADITDRSDTAEGRLAHFSTHPNS